MNPENTSRTIRKKLRGYRIGVLKQAKQALNSCM